ncbi:hypothetical protein GCM10010116_43580 [Microbispora rosea subsp. aerata]|nr:hypothetical protein GCM10010116_43580 [Microbispora rosea subsp. aerata]
MGRVILRWETAHGSSYRIRTSADGSAWTTVAQTATGDGGADKRHGAPSGLRGRRRAAAGTRVGLPMPVRRR